MAAWLTAGSAKYCGVDKGIALTDVLLRLSLPFMLKDFISMSPGIELTALIDSDLRAARKSRQNMVFYITFSSSFK